MITKEATISDWAPSALRRTIHIALNPRSRWTNPINLLGVLYERWVRLNVNFQSIVEFMTKREHVIFRVSRRFKDEILNHNYITVKICLSTIKYNLICCMLNFPKNKRHGYNDESFKIGCINDHAYSKC